MFKDKYWSCWIAAYLEDSALLPKLTAVLELCLDGCGEQNALPGLRFSETVSWQLLWVIALENFCHEQSEISISNTKQQRKLKYVGKSKQDHSSHWNYL